MPSLDASVYMVALENAYGCPVVNLDSARTLLLRAMRDRTISVSEYLSLGRFVTEHSRRFGRSK